MCAEAGRAGRGAPARVPIPGACQPLAWALGGPTVRRQLPKTGDARVPGCAQAVPRLCREPPRRGATAANTQPRLQKHGMRGGRAPHTMALLATGALS